MARYALVTGANAPSLGFHVAQRLAGEPHRFRVILGCRSRERGLAAAQAICAADKGAWVAHRSLDLASLASVREFAAELRTELGGGGLALLVANAGVGFGLDKTRRLTEDGFELRLGVNHLGHFLLVNLLMPELRAAPQSRVVVVSSSLHALAVSGEAELLDLDDLQLARPGAYEVRKAYNRSKLANLLFTFELQRRLESDRCANVSACALTPGFIPQTGLGREAGVFGVFFMQYILDGLLKRLGLVKFTRTVNEGATCVVLCSTAAAASKGGGYFELSADGTEIVPAATSDEGRDEVKAKRLWELSEELVGLKH
eukprot:scaffold67068_cov25-Tisochrysis_lutea.AAC.2